MTATLNDFQDTDLFAPLQGSRNPEYCDLQRLNELLHQEMAACETYEKALRRYSDNPHVEGLSIIRDEHAASAATLRDRILTHGGEPESHVGTWESFSRTMSGLAVRLGYRAALLTLCRGEQTAVARYESVLEHDAMSRDCRELIVEELLPQCRLHVGELIELLDGE